MKMTFSDIILILGSVQGLLLALMIIHKNRLNRANRILAILVLAYSLFMLNLILFNSGMLIKNPIWIISLDGLPLLFGPLHYLYTRFLSSKSEKFHWQDSLHFIPFILYRFYFIDAYFTTKQELISVIKDMQVNPPAVFIISGWVIAVQGLVYMLLTLQVIKNYEIKIRDIFSSIDHINLNWLRNITYMTLVIWIVVFIENILQTIGSDLLGVEAQLVGLLTAIFVYIMAYIGLSRSEIFLQMQIQSGHNSEALSMNLNAPAENTSKYSKSGLSEEKAMRYKQQLQTLMQTEKPYRDNNLTLQNLSDKLDISAHNLSEIINTRLNLNFFDFVNSYRVEDVKQKLTDPQNDHLKILAVAYDSGFNSKTSFNAIFKKVTGKTPSDFRNQNTYTGK